MEIILEAYSLDQIPDFRPGVIWTAATHKSACELIQPLLARAKTKFWGIKHLLLCKAPLAGSPGIVRARGCKEQGCDVLLLSRPTGRPWGCSTPCRTCCWAGSSHTASTLGRHGSTLSSGRSDALINFGLCLGGVSSSNHHQGVTHGGYHYARLSHYGGTHEQAVWDIQAELRT